jgi:hypothetical protein
MMRWTARPSGGRPAADRLVLAARWQGFPVDIGFRLGRWSSHLREHTIQVEKTLVMLGHTPTEVDRLIRLVLAAWGRAEAAVYGLTDADEAIGLLASAAADATATASEVIRSARASDKATISDFPQRFSVRTGPGPDPLYRHVRGRNALMPDGCVRPAGGF